jgi:hypothetical protein
MAEICPIWSTPARIITPGTGDSVLVDSSRCGGKYVISKTALTMLSNFDDAKRRKLTDQLIKQRLRGIYVPEIKSYFLNNVSSWQEAGITERINNFLFYISKNAPLLGKLFRFSSVESHDPITLELLAWTSSLETSEVCYIARYCNEERFVELSLAPQIYSLYLTPKGIGRLENILGSIVSSNQCFVAMWFNKIMDDAFEKGIDPGIRDAGYTPLRVDQKDHNNKIDDLIISEIKRSRFLVADFTQESEARGGVYYEAGFAHGLNIPVIFSCHKNSLEKVHFDTRQYNHIVWEHVDELREKLRLRIEATIGRNLISI